MHVSIDGRRPLRFVDHPEAQDLDHRADNLHSAFPSSSSSASRRDRLLAGEAMHEPEREGRTAVTMLDANKGDEVP